MFRASTRTALVLAMALWLTFLKRDSDNNISNNSDDDDDDELAKVVRSEKRGRKLRPEIE